MDVFSAVRSHRRGLGRVWMSGVLAAGRCHLAGCYVVPIDPRTGQAVPPPPAAMAAVPAAPLTFPARLYPANDLASGYGVINATVTNDLQGRGSFNTTINGEAFAGRPRARPDPAAKGLANGAGNRGSYLTCAYTMNSATLGSGTCRLSNGALFSMHVGN